jgi:hypothetical protein
MPDEYKCPEEGPSMAGEAKVNVEIVYCVH